MTNNSFYACIYERGNANVVHQRLLSYLLQVRKLIDSAATYSQYGYFDWVNVAKELGNGFTNVQCKTKWRNLLLKGKVSIDEAEYMDAAYTPDPGYIYDDDVEVAFKNKIKRLQRKSTVWPPEMV